MDIFKDPYSARFRIAYWTLRVLAAGTGAFLFLGLALNSFGQFGSNPFGGRYLLTKVFWFMHCFMLIAPHRLFVRTGLFKIKLAAMTGMTMYLIVSFAIKAVPMTKFYAQYGATAIVIVWITCLLMALASLAGVYTPETD